MSEEKYRAIFKNSIDAILLTSPDGTILEVNPAACKMFRMTEEEIIKAGRSGITDSSDPRLQPALEERAGTGKFRGELNYRRKDGTIFPAEVSSAVFKDKDGIERTSMVVRDITERKHFEMEREMSIVFLQLMNESKGTTDLVHSVVSFFRERFSFEAVGIRLKDGDDYPYFEASGFPKEFVKLENSLCARDEAGQPICDNAGNPILECMCGNVICGRFDTSKPFFTERGSFWTNSTTELLTGTTDDDRQARTRNRCNGEGYESVALIALRVGEKRLGLLQLNDRRKGQFSPETISMWERLADYLAVALAKTRAEEKLHVAYENLQVQSEELQAQSEEIHEANKVLLENEARFRTMANAIPQLAWIARPDGYIYWYNERWYAYTGTTPEQMEGWGWQSVHDPEVLPKVLEQWKASIATGQKFDMEFPLRGADGIFRQFLTRVLPLKDASGNILQWFGTNTDVTERKKTEEALKKAHDSLEVKVKERTAELEGAYKLSLENERRFNEAQKLAHIGSWDWDIATDELYWSAETYRIFGSDTHEFSATYCAFLNYIHPDDRDNVDVAVKKALNGKPFGIDYRIILANGAERTLHTQGGAIFDEKNTPIRIRGTVQDITERKKVEESLQESEEKYRNIVEIANEGVLVIDAELRISYYNQKLMEMLGFNPAECIGRSIWEFISKEGKATVKHNLEKRRQGINESYELELIRKDGSSLWVLITAKSLFDEDGKFMGSISMLTDITKRKEAEEALANIEIARKKEIHHRIKNNLQVISSLLDLQAEKFRDKECFDNSEVLKAFRESQDRVMSIALIHEELHEGRGKDTLNFSPYLKRLIKNLFQTYRLGDIDISLDMDLEEDTFFDMDIAVPLGMIVNELVSNSLKYAFSGRNKGEIRIKLRRDKKGENGEFISSRKESKSEVCKSSSYTLTISDNGIGIPENIDIEDLESLGLQLVTTLVDQLDGELELKRNNGTEFFMRFTVIEKNNGASAPALQ